MKDVPSVVSQTMSAKFLIILLMYFAVGVPVNGLERKVPPHSSGGMVDFKTQTFCACRSVQSTS